MLTYLSTNDSTNFPLNATSLHNNDAGKTAYIGTNMALSGTQINQLNMAPAVYP